MRDPIITGRHRSSVSKLFASVWVSLLLISNTFAQSSAVFDFNATRTPSFLVWDPSLTAVGWYITPNVSLNLSKIETNFSPVVQSGSQNRNVTVEILTDRRSIGGTLLRSATFNSAVARGQLGGGSFAPVMLTAGTRYFIGFRNVAGIGINTTNDAGSVNCGACLYLDNASSAEGQYQTRGGTDLPSQVDQPILRLIAEVATPTPTPTPASTPTPTPSPTPVPTPGPPQIEQCTGGKTTTLPLSGDYGSIGQLTVTRQTIPNPNQSAPAPVSVFIPSNASAQNKRPVVFFAHGFGGVDYRFYEALLNQLASNGYIVVFSPFTDNFLTTHTVRYNQLWDGFLAAAGQNAAIMDLTRVGFAGHSYGAGASPDMARRGVAQGWGSNGLFLFIMAAWYNWGTNLQQIPPSAKMVVQVYWDDGTTQHLISQNDIWNRLPQITERTWQVIRASHMHCMLRASHSIPVTDGLGQTVAALDAYDSWGVWRRLHALSDYTFSGSQTARNIAFGGDAHMGRWWGTFAIRPLESSAEPVVNSQSSPTFLWNQKCLFALGSPCP